MNRITTIGAGVLLALSLAVPLISLAAVGNCPPLTYALSRGASDADTGSQVSALQQFLTSYFNLSDNIVAGYFGPKTALYVSQFQAANNLPQVGTVGPLTRAAILNACLTHGPAVVPAPVGTSPTLPSSTPPAEVGTSSTPLQVACNLQTGVGCPLPSISFAANPSSGTAPLTVQFTARLNDGSTYAIYFGDGSSGAMTPGTWGTFDHMASHLYPLSGVYTATIQDSTGRLLGIATVSTNGTVQTINAPSQSTPTTPSSSSAGTQQTSTVPAATYPAIPTPATTPAPATPVVVPLPHAVICSQSIQVPICLNGTLVPAGNDANGCPLPPTCTVSGLSSTHLWDGFSGVFGQ